MTDLTINLQINAQVPKVCHPAWHVSRSKTTCRLISHLGGCRMPVRGHEGQMGQHPHLRASQKLRSLGLCLGQEVKEKSRVFFWRKKLG